MSTAEQMGRYRNGLEMGSGIGREAVLGGAVLEGAVLGGRRYWEGWYRVVFLCRTNRCPKSEFVLFYFLGENWINLMIVRIII